MALLDDLAQILARLAPRGWASLKVQQHGGGLDITKPKSQLAAEYRDWMRGPFNHDTTALSEMWERHPCEVTRLAMSRTQQLGNRRMDYNRLFAPLFARTGAEKSHSPAADDCCAPPPVFAGASKIPGVLTESP